MLIEFSIGNYKSFKDVVTLSMVAAKLRSKNKEIDATNIFKVSDKLSLLKSTAIYGANASGKSNLIKALAFMRRFVLNSSKNSQAMEIIEVENFKLSTITETEPSYFEVTFLIDDRQYRYGFEVDVEQVHSEWLYHIPNKRETYLFLREKDEITCSSVFKEGKGLEDKTRNNALFLSVVAQFNGSIAQNILQWFSKLGIISGLFDMGYKGFTLKSVENDTLKNEIFSLVKQMDLGISDIKLLTTSISDAELPQKFLKAIEKLTPGTILDVEASTITVTTLHKKYDNSNQTVSWEAFDLDQQESEGTQKLFYFSGPLLNTLQSGRILIVDELDARFHPLITSFIISLFNANRTNPNNAQLIFATHDTNLLSNRFFRRDQIWFTEKDKYGATDLYSLAEYKVRNDATFEKDYIAGRYGAIPFLGGMIQVIGEQDAQKN